MPKHADPEQDKIRCQYFVDEAGDGTIFDRRGKDIIGTPGCSRYFLLGLLQVEDPEKLESALNELRTRLLADPYFRNVHSMQPSQKKTALAFHAKDDVQEIRREVFSLLREFSGLRYFAVVRDKKKVLDYVRQRNLQDQIYRYNANELYDFMVRRLFLERLHQYGEYEITFARRGNSDRTAALMEALQMARTRFEARWHKASNAPITIKATTPPHCGALQAADYFNWALQRVFEQGEDRYITYLWNHFRLVIDIDDIRKNPYGVYYNKSKPLTADVLGGH